MFKLLSIAAALALASAAFAQTPQPGQTTPNVAPSETPAVTPSQSPSVAPSQTPYVTPSQTPVIGGPAPAIGGLGKCENMIGLDKDRCLQDERARVGNTGGRPAGAGGSHAPGSTGTGAGTMGSQNTAPAGSVR